MKDSVGFDAWAYDYDTSVKQSAEADEYPFAGYDNVLNEIFEAVQASGPSRILDIGFGTGALTQRLYSAGHSITGLDFSEKMIELARAKMPQARLMAWDISQGIPPVLDEESFDFILSTYALHHLLENEKISFLQKCGAILSDSGKILIGDIAFVTHEELEACKKVSGSGWDPDESYLVFDELKHFFPLASFRRASHCAGILSLTNRDFIEIR